MKRDDFARLSSTYAMILLAWIVLAAAATGPALIAASALGGRGPNPMGALAFESLLEGRRVIGASWIAFASPLLLLLLASPWLSVSWLSALGRREPLRESLSLGARRYGSAVVSSLLLVPLLLVSLGLLAAGPLLASAVVGDVDARASDLWSLVACLPGLMALAAWAACHDLARARLAITRESAALAVLGAIRQLRPRAVLRYALFFTLALTLAGLGVMATGALSSALALVTGQLFVLARLGVRGLYLAGLVR